MLDKLEVPREVVVRMVNQGGAGSIAQTAAKDTAAVDASYAGMASSVGGSTGAMAEETKSSMAKGSSALGSFSGAGKNMEKDLSGLMSKTRGSISSLVGPLGSMLPMAAAVGFGALLYGTTNTAYALKQFQEQAGVSLGVAKEWSGAASDFSVPPRALSMVIKNLGMMLNNVTHASGTTIVSQQALAAETEQVTIAHEKLLIAEAKLKDATDKYGTSSTQAATAEIAVQTTQEALTKAEEKATTVKQGVAGLTAKQNQALQDLGVSLKDSNGKVVDSTTLMGRLADAYQKVTDGTNKNITAAQASADITAILGGRAFAILPMLEQGGAALNETLKKGAEANKEYNQSNVNALAQAKVNINNITDAVKNALVGFASNMTPVVNFLDTHLSQLTTLAATIGGLYLMKKAWNFGSAVVSDLSSIIKFGPQAVAKLSGVLTSVTSTGTSAGGSILSKITGSLSQVVVQAFGPEAVATLEATGAGGGVVSGVEGAAGKILPAAVVGGETAAEAGTIASIAGSIVGSAAFLPVAAAASLAIMGVLGFQHIMDEKNKPQFVQDANIAKVKSQLGVKNTGSDPMKYGLTDPFAPTKQITVSAKQAAMAWEQIAGEQVGTAKALSNWRAILTPLLEKTGASADTIALEEANIADLVKSHKITSAATLATYETDWNNIASHAKDSEQAENLFKGMVQKNKLNMDTQGPAFITAWNTMVKEGVQPAAIDAQSISQEMANIQAIASAGAAIDTSAVAKLIRQSNKNPNAMAGGGIISEPIFGVGQRTGDTYTFGEGGIKEAVTPMTGGSALSGGGGGGGGGGQPIYIDMRGTQIWKTADIDNMVDRMGARLAKFLMPASGTQFQFKR